MSEQSAFRPERARAVGKWTVTLSLLGVATLVLYRIAVHSKGVADIAWFLKLVAVQIVIYVAVAWLSLHTKDSRALLLLGRALHFLPISTPVLE